MWFPTIFLWFGCLQIHPSWRPKYWAATTGFLCLENLYNSLIVHLFGKHSSLSFSALNPPNHIWHLVTVLSNITVSLALRLLLIGGSLFWWFVIYFSIVLYIRVFPFVDWFAKEDHVRCLTVGHYFVTGANYVKVVEKHYLLNYLVL